VRTVGPHAVRDAGHGPLALAVLPLETSDAELQVGGVVAQRVPLLDGLAR